MDSGRNCCLIPAFNEAGTIAEVVRPALKHVPHVIVVDDGSVDSTAELALKAGAVVLRHERNRGKGMALRTGFAHVLRQGYESVVTLDADGQHDTSEIGKFLTAHGEGSGDIIIGTRLWDRAAIPRYRYIPNRIGIFCISRAAGCRIDDSQSGFRLYRRKVLKDVSLTTTGFETETEILIKAARQGFRVFNLPVSAIYPRVYKTNFRPVRDFYRISMVVLKLSVFGGAR